MSDEITNKQLKKIIDEWAKTHNIQFCKLEIDIQKEVVYIRVTKGYKKEDLE